MLVPRSRRMVPGAAFLGSVAPIVSRHLRMAPSASRTRAKILPELMKSVSSPKKGRSLWNSIEAACFFFGQTHGFDGDDFKTGLMDSAEDFTLLACFDSIRLDNCESAFE